MALALNRPPKLTYRVDLPGGQSRLREATLYVCEKCENAPYFGLTKLNKILWFADFTSFAERAQPITGRMYQRLEHGPAPAEMLPLLMQMQKDGEIAIDKVRILSFDERRPKALVHPVLNNFSNRDLHYLNVAIKALWDVTGTSASDLSHGVAWKTRDNGDPMPYELAYLSDHELPPSLRSELERIGRERGWHSH